MTTFIGNWITLHDQPDYVNSINNDMLRQIVMKNYGFRVLSNAHTISVPSNAIYEQYYKIWYRNWYLRTMSSPFS